MDTGDRAGPAVGPAAGSRVGTETPARMGSSGAVRRLVRTRRCARPGCGAPAQATLSFVYAERRVLIEDLSAEPQPATYDLCASHAARTTPPHGWTMSDRRQLDPAAEVLPHPAGQQAPASAW